MSSRLPPRSADVVPVVDPCQDRAFQWEEHSDNLGAVHPINGLPRPLLGTGRGRRARAEVLNL